MKSNEAEHAAYIGDLAQQLSRMARAAGHDLLAYILDMAKAEARRLAEEASKRKHRINAD